jgi:hypothetical protein
MLTPGLFQLWARAVGTRAKPKVPTVTSATTDFTIFGAPFLHKQRHGR